MGEGRKIARVEIFDGLEDTCQPRYSPARRRKLLRNFNKGPCRGYNSAGVALSLGEPILWFPRHFVCLDLLTSLSLSLYVIESRGKIYYVTCNEYHLRFEERIELKFIYFVHEFIEIRNYSPMNGVRWILYDYIIPFSLKSTLKSKSILMFLSQRSPIQSLYCILNYTINVSYSNVSLLYFCINSSVHRSIIINLTRFV